MEKLSNEELALLIQKGHTEHYNELWDNTYKLISIIAYKHYAAYYEKCLECGVTLEDLQQSGFIALTFAVKAYNTDKGFAFTTYLNQHIKNQCFELLGKRTHKNDCLNNCSSLDVKLDDDSIRLIDCIPDSTDHYITTEEKIFNEELSIALKDCISSLSDKQQSVINGRYFGKHTLKHLSQILEMSFESVRSIEQASLKQLRTEDNLKRLKPFAGEIFSRAITGTGLNSFKHRRGSSVELTTEQLDRLYSNIKAELAAKENAILNNFSTRLAD